MSTFVIEKPNDLNKKVHPWRYCPLGKHLVREHSIHIPPSKKYPNGIISTQHEHCAFNRSHKDELSYDEIQYITNTYFLNLMGTPTAGILNKEFPKADAYDKEIRGWVKYWNEVFQSNDPLDPNLIKALIATESSFNSEPQRIKTAHGLLQIMNSTLNYLQDTKGELKNYLVCLTKKELLNPSANICAGIRWLFRKKETASAKLQCAATWINALEDYKGFLDKIINKESYNHKPMEKLNEYYALLQVNNSENTTSSDLIAESLI